LGAGFTLPATGSLAVSGISLRLLGGFELRHGQEPVSLPLSGQRLLVFLALARRAIQRVYVAGMLWMDYSQEAANANLRTTLWRLPRTPGRLVDAGASHLSLSPEVDVDLHQVSGVARRLSGGGSGYADDEAQALMLAGDLLPDWYEDWVILERERFRQSRLHALESLCDTLVRAGRYPEAIEVGLTVVAGEPLRESAHRAVIRAHLAEGNNSEGLRQYAMLRRFLHEQLGLEPSAEAEMLRDRCRFRDGVVTGSR
jgi:DNA-binding SARP family transcriptional activator